jgi:hypothetical protein
MSRHLSITDIDRYRSKAITADEVRGFDSHLAECEKCRRSFLDSDDVEGAYELVRDSLRSIPQSTEMHIAYEEMAAYVDGHLDAMKRDPIEAHIESCRDCESDIAELKRLRETISTDEDTAVSQSLASAPFWQGTAFRIGLEALSVLLIIAAVVWFSSRQIRALRTENDQLRESLRESEAAIAELEHRIDSLEPADPGKKTANEPQIALELKDGAGLVTIDAEGTLRGLDSVPEQYRHEVKEVLESSRVSLPPVVTQLRGSTETTMGNIDELPFNLLSPVGIVVEKARPEFRWTPFSDAIDYQVSVSNRHGETIQRATVSGTSWRPSTPLARGRVYQWQVRATTKDGRELKIPAVGQEDAKFKILSHRESNEVEQARRAYSNSHLVMGTIYAKVGLVNEARQQFRALLKANPESRIGRRILASLKRK